MGWNSTALKCVLKDSPISPKHLSPIDMLLRPFLTACAAAFALLPAASAQTAERFNPADYFDVWVHGVDAADIYAFTQLGLDIQGREGDELFCYLSSSEIDELFRLGYQLGIAPKAGAGTQAGYHTFPQLTTDLQSFVANYPSLAKLHNLGTSVQGRELWMIEISDNVGVEENEPEFKYISTMHGDEVVGMELSMNLIDHLLTNYGVDPAITSLVDETSIWIMPLMNPDGYVAHSRYNAQGYDLNREFPDRINDTVNTTAGRPIEVQHVMNFGFAHSPVISANFHGGALVVNYPYDSDSSPWAGYSATPDDGLMIASALTYAQLNTPMFQSPVFNQGIVNGVEWYSVYGGMQDWNYVWQGCNDVTIELSNTKWPSSGTLPGYWSDNKDSMLAYLQLAQQGARGLVTDAASGLPLAASVRVVGVDHSVYTDPDVGDYHRLTLPGTYDLEVSAPGHLTQVVSGVVVGSGNASVVDVALVANGGGGGATPDIKINGQDGPLTVLAAGTTQITVGMAPGTEIGVSKDWWISVTNGSATFYWTLAGGWGAAAAPAYQGALFALPSFTVVSGNLPPGTWTFDFAVDAPDGVYQGTALDSAQVTSN